MSTKDLCFINRLLDNYFRLVCISQVSYLNVKKGVNHEVVVPQPVVGRPRVPLNINTLGQVIGFTEELMLSRVTGVDDNSPEVQEVDI